MQVKLRTKGGAMVTSDLSVLEEETGGVVSLPLQF